MAATHRPLSTLGAIRNRYGGSAAADKLALMADLDRHRPGRPREIAQWHDHLLYLAAFPDNRAVRDSALHGLSLIEAQVLLMRATHRRRLDDSGIIGTRSHNAYELTTLRDLVGRHRDELDFDWPAMSDSGPVDLLIGLACRRAEQDGLEIQRLTTPRWLRRARAGRGTDVAWLLAELDALRMPARLLAPLYDQLGIPVVWRLTGSIGSTTANRRVPRRVHYRSRGLRALPADPKRLIATPLPGIRLAPAREAYAYLAIARDALASRCREVYAVTHGNPREVYVVGLGSGVELAVIGVTPDRRLSLDSNYGYLLISNAVPVGYGGVTPLLRQANTGINIFEPFRGTEAAFLWAQMLRSFRTLFGSTRFIVNPYQFGAGNSEAIASGAFWFYDRLGFRSTDPGLAAVAEVERGRRRRHPGHRTDASTLRRLAGADIELVLPGWDETLRIDEAWPPQWSLSATQLLGARAGVRRAAAEHALAREVARALGVGSMSGWHPAERTAFAALAPVVALIDPGTLPSARRRALVSLMRAKGAPQERDFVRACAREPELFRRLIRLSRAGGD